MQLINIMHFVQRSYRFFLVWFPLVIKFNGSIFTVIWCRIFAEISLNGLASLNSMDEGHLFINKMLIVTREAHLNFNRSWNFQTKFQVLYPLSFRQKLYWKCLVAWIVSLGFRILFRNHYEFLEIRKLHISRMTHYTIIFFPRHDCFVWINETTQTKLFWISTDIVNGG